MIQAISDIREELTPDVMLAIRLEFEAAQPHKKFNASSFVSAWDQLIGRGMGALWVMTHGGMMIGATGAIAHVEPVEGIMVVAQAFMFLRRDYRGPSDALRLMQAIESFAKAKNAARIIAAVCYDTMDGRQASFLEHQGYAQYETRYFKKTQWEQKP